MNLIVLSENDENNLEVAIAINDLMSSFISKKALTQEQVENELSNIPLNARIMYSFIEQTEHFVFTKKAYGRISFFNLYELKTRDFFNKHTITSFIPHLIDENKARLKGNFNNDGKIVKENGKEYCIKNLFVGFGAFNSQMLKDSLKTGQLLGCDYNAIIYDEQINAQKPCIRQSAFENNSFGLFPGGDETLKGEKYFKSSTEKYNIQFKNANVLSRKFYTDLVQETTNNDITLIYIALGDGNLGTETAFEIRQCLFIHGVSPDKVRIFVKMNVQATSSSNDIVNYEGSIPIPIEFFGADNVVMTKEHIIGMKMDELARKMVNKNHGMSWGQLTETKRDSNRQSLISVRTKLNLLGFDLVDDGDNYDNNIYLQRYSKGASKRIMEIISCSIDQALKNGNSDKSHLILDYVQTNDDGSISDTSRNNLARLEHLRWNTFHLVGGWTKLPISAINADNSGRQNKLTKQHGCITTFENLIKLRKLQVEKALEKTDMTSEDIIKAEVQADTIWYDYVLMDELPAYFAKKILCIKNI